MEASILKSTKKILGVGPDDDSFDLDILTHINAAFSDLQQLGVGPRVGFSIEDEESKWENFPGVPVPMLGMVKVFVFLKTKLLFDPPATSFHLTALENQIEQMAWRLNVAREETDWTDPDPDTSHTVEALEEHVIIDGGGP